MRFPSTIIAFLLAVVLGLGSSAKATIYYIDFANGNNTNNGLLASAPWKHCPGDVNATGNPATAILQPGDTVIFKGRVRYLGTVTIKWSGEPGNPITYDGNSVGTFGTGKAIIDGEGEQLGINARRYGFYCPSQYQGPGLSRLAISHLVINNFEITNLRYMYDANLGPSGISMNGDADGTDVEIKNSYLHQIKKKAVAIDVEQGSISLTDTTFTDDGQDFTNYAGMEGQVATHNIHIGWSPLDYDRANGFIGPLNGNANSVKIYKDIYLTQEGWNYGPGYNPVGKSVSFYWVYNLQQGAHILSGGVGIAVCGYRNVSIYDNIIKEVPVGIDYVSLPTTDTPTNVDIYNNDVSLASWGIRAAATTMDLDQLNIYNNTIHDFKDYWEYCWGWHNDPFFIAATSTGTVKNVQFYNNYIYGNIGGATGLLYISRYTDGVKIFNNVFASSAGSGMLIRTGGGAAIDDISVYNNVFAHIPGEQKGMVSFIENTANVRLRNNIFYLPEEYPGAFSLLSDVGSSSDYNLLHTADDNRIGLFYGGQAYTIEQWQNANLPDPHDQNSVVSEDPLFKAFPKFAAEVNLVGTTATRAYLEENTNSNYDHTFVVGDYIEYDYDGVVRTVTEVGADYIEFTPARPDPSESMPTIIDRMDIGGIFILNWKDIDEFVYDLSLKPGSPLIDAGTDVSAEIGSLDKNGVSRPQGSNWDIGAYEFRGNDPPVISQVQTSNITSSEATVTWLTHVPATSLVEYGLDTSYDYVTDLDTNLVTVHTIQLTS
ncbi:choice-of-anchor Q domain-containing protein, partial [Planctomycetota bacterium]